MGFSPCIPAHDDEPLGAASAALSDIPPLRSPGTSIVLSFRRRPYRRGICCQLAAPNHPPRILLLIPGRWPIQARLWLEWGAAYACKESPVIPTGAGANATAKWRACPEPCRREPASSFPPPRAHIGTNAFVRPTAGKHARAKALPPFLFSTAFHRKNLTSCDEQPLLRISERANSLHARGSPNQFAKNAPPSGLECEAKSLFRKILTISPYGSRFCPDRLISTNANSNEMRILGRYSKKNYGGGQTGRYRPAGFLTL